MAQELTHLDGDGQAHMVDVGAKDITKRSASAKATLQLRPETMAVLRGGETPKGDVYATARIAAIQAAKETPRLIPLCHHIALTGVSVEFDHDEDGERLHIIATAKCRDRTGVEMEAMTAASVAALTVYDMLKAIERGIAIEGVVLLTKDGGRTGSWARQ